MKQAAIFVGFDDSILTGFVVLHRHCQCDGRDDDYHHGGTGAGGVGVHSAEYAVGNTETNADRKENGRFIVYEEEAVIVRRIYAEYLQGYGLLTICRRLNQEGIVMEKSGCIWRKKAVRYILTNEKYIGDCLWRKQYTEMCFGLVNKCAVKTHPKSQ